MCLAAICVDAKMSPEIIRKAWKTNSHGAGIVWVGANRKANYIKGIDKVEALQELVDKTELPFVIHFRLASVGGIDPLLTQPFEITEKSTLRLQGQCNRVLVHNGTDHDWKKCLAAGGFALPKDENDKEEPISDSRAFAMILSRHKNNDFLNAVSGRFVVVGYGSPTDEYALRYFGDSWTEEQGIFYSNMLWKYEKVTSSYAPKHDFYHHRSIGFTPTEQLKKKDETQRIPTLLKSFKFFSKPEKLDYRRWWKTAIQNPEKYKLLPAPVIQSPLPNPVINQQQKELTRQEFFGGAGESMACGEI
jgi:hypothetical protein